MTEYGEIEYESRPASGDFI